MPSNIIVIPLEILRNDPKYHAAFEKLDPSAKLACIEERIRSLCEQLKTSEPDAMWVFALREYAITSGATYRPVPCQFKKIEFKERLKAITADYSNAMIIAGTISTHKAYPASKAATIKRYYDAHEWIKTQEASRGDKQMLSHLEEVEKLTLLNPSEEINVIRNTCYIAKAGSIIYRHDKTAPYFECHLAPLLRNQLFQPAKENNLSPVCSVIHPITQETVSIGVDICRENILGSLDNYLSNNPSIKKPDLAVVIADSIDQIENFQGGHYLVHIDSSSPARLIVSETANETSACFSLIKNNLFDGAELGNRQRKFTLADYQLLVVLDQLIDDLPNNHKGYASLVAIRKSAESSLLKTSTALHKHLAQALINDEFDRFAVSDMRYKNRFEAAKANFIKHLKQFENTTALRPTC